MNLITDRTQADVLLGTEKGRYSVADLNRVEQAVAEIYSIAKELDVSGISQIKTDWACCEGFSPKQWPTQSQMARYLSNIIRLCEGVEIAANLPRTMENLTFDGANQIEKALFAAYNRILDMIQIFRFSGEVFAGEENAL